MLLLIEWKGPRSDDAVHDAVGEEGRQPTADVSIALAPQSLSSPTAPDPLDVAVERGRTAPDSAIGRVRIVEHGLGERVIGASVKSIDAEGNMTEHTATDGSFDPVGTAPHLVEVAADGFATRWAVVPDADVDLTLWRFGSVSIEVTDEAGRPVHGFRVSLRPHVPLNTEVFSIMSAFAAERKAVKDRRYAHQLAVRRNDGSAYDHFAPAPDYPIGPDFQRLSGASDALGVLRLDPVVVASEYTLWIVMAGVRCTEPAGHATPWGEKTAYVSGPFDVAVGADTRVRVVLEGTCAVTFGLDESGFASPPSPSDRAYRFFARVPAADGADSEIFEPVRTWQSAPTRVGAISLCGFEPGTHRVWVRWQGSSRMPDADQVIDDHRYVLREFDLQSGESIDLGTLFADPGVADVTFVLRTSSGEAVPAAVAFPPVDGGGGRHSSAHPTVKTGIKNHAFANGPVVSIESYLSYRDGRFLLRGFGRHPVAVDVSPSVYIEQAVRDWRFVGPSSLEFPNGLSGKIEIPVGVVSSSVIEFVVAPGADGEFTAWESDATVVLSERESGATERVVMGDTLNWARLSTKRALPRGSWVGAGSLVSDRSDAPLLGLAHEGRTLAELQHRDWYRLDCAFDNSLGGSLKVELQHVLAASLRLSYAEIDGKELEAALDARARDYVPIDKALDARMPIVFADHRWIAAEEDGTLLLRGLPPNALVRLLDGALEVTTSGPGSIVDAYVSQLTSNDATGGD